MTLLEELLRLRDEGPKQPLLGICSNVSGYGDELEGHFEAMGLDAAYPVAAPCGGEHAAREQYVISSSAAMWDRTPGTYGANRWALLDALIERLEAQ